MPSPRTPDKCNVTDRFFKSMLHEQVNMCLVENKLGSYNIISNIFLAKIASNRG